MSAAGRVGAGWPLLVPLLLWTLALYLLRRRGDPSDARRRELERHFSAEEIAAGRAQTLRRNQLALVAELLSLTFFGILLFGGGARRLELISRELLPGHWAGALALFLLLIVGLYSLLSLPLSAYSVFVVERRSGLSTTSPALWLSDQLKGLVLSLALSYLAALPLLALIAALPRAWPLPTAAVLLALAAFMIWLKPWLLDPWFNRFAPLDDPELAEDVRQLTARAGLPVSQVFVMDASRRSRLLNAYFTGLGSSQRVVLYDTLLSACSRGEVLSVLAHELGHHQGRHILKSFLLGALGLVLGLQLFAWGWQHPGLRELFGLAPDSLLALTVLLPFLGGLGGTVVAPLQAAVSRRFERAADGAALELTGDPASFITLEQKLVRRSKSDLLRPRLIHWWYDSHPLPEERIAAAERWKASAP